MQFVSRVKWASATTSKASFKKTALGIVHKQEARVSTAVGTSEEIVACLCVVRRNFPGEIAKAKRSAQVHASSVQKLLQLSQLFTYLTSEREQHIFP